MTDRDGDAPAGDGDPSPPGREVAHRVVRLADLAGAGPHAPVASLRGFDPEGEPAPVVDLRAWARGGNPAPGRRRGRPRTFADTPPPAGGADGERGTPARPARRARQPRASARDDHRTDGAQRDHPALDEVGRGGEGAHGGRDGDGGRDGHGTEGAQRDHPALDEVGRGGRSAHDAPGGHDAYRGRDTLGSPDALGGHDTVGSGDGERGSGDTSDTGDTSDSGEPGARGGRRSGGRWSGGGGAGGRRRASETGGKAAGSRAERERREIEADPVAVAREICLRLLTERARTRQELAQALRKREVPDEAANAVLERFDEVGLIDDAAFAGQWVRSRHSGRGLARRAIAVELRRKGVADEVAQEALAEVDTDAEEQRARELVDRKLRTVPADTPERRTTAARRLVGMLARRGYPAGIAYRVVREALAAHGAEEDELGEPDA